MFYALVKEDVWSSLNFEWTYSSSSSKSKLTNSDFRTIKFRVNLEHYYSSDVIDMGKMSMTNLRLIWPIAKLTLFLYAVIFFQTLVNIIEKLLKKAFTNTIFSKCEKMAHLILIQKHHLVKFYGGEIVE